MIPLSSSASVYQSAPCPRSASIWSAGERYPGEDTHLAPSLPAAVERLMQPILSGRIAPTQTIAIDED